MGIKRKLRPRGGASVPCPECGANSSVVVTARKSTAVSRLRRCSVCPTKFKTTETKEKSE